MTRLLRTALSVLLCLAAGMAVAEVRLKRIVLSDRDTRVSLWLVLADTDHDGLGEAIYSTWYGPITNRVRGWEILEYRPLNRYELVHADTGTKQAPETLLVGNFWPCDAGDIDRDGKSDLVGTLRYRGHGMDSLVLCTIESRDSASYPDTLTWYVDAAGDASSPNAPFFSDLDGDSAEELLSPWEMTSAIFENVGDDRESLICEVPHANAYSEYVFGDFDQNRKRDYAFMYGSRVDICEWADSNRYVPVCSLWGGFSNHAEIFGGHDADRNGKPEFFVVYAELEGMSTRLYLYQFEASAEHDYQYYFIDTTLIRMAGAGVRSVCTDLDGDSIDEIVWGAGTHIIILKADGEHQFQRVGYWSNDQGLVTRCNAADFNGNGYPEVYVGGDSLLSVLEIEAIKVLNPDTSRHLTSGDTCEIRWQVFTPPRCDSVSLFLRTDTTIANGFYRLDTIAHGLSPSESTYSWVVPDTTLDSARILAIAYGPGWQFDESDSALRIAPAGVAGPRIAPPRNWSLSVSPNPARGALRVSYDVPRQCRVLIGVYDVDGRLVRTLAGGVLTAGWYQVVLTPPVLPAGVYYVRLDNGDSRITRKVVLTD
jgi:hypothetical protein